MKNCIELKIIYDSVTASTRDYINFLHGFLGIDQVFKIITFYL